MKELFDKGLANRHAFELATGRMEFAGDLRHSDALHGVLLRSTQPHARLLHVDVDRAKRLPGVKLVLTGKDVPHNRFGRYLKDLVLLAGERVLYVGEPVALIAGVDEETAIEACEMIRVDYEPLQPLLDPRVAMSEEMILLHPDVKTYGASWEAIRGGNVCSKTTIQRGDVRAAFDGSYAVVENTFETPAVHQCSLETQVAMAARDSSGRLLIHMPTQLPFANQMMFAEALQVKPSRIRVHATPAGGSFGSKLENIAGLYAALAACHLDRPVRVGFRRDEEFVAVAGRHPSLITVKTGVKKDGTLTAWQARVIFDTGAYAWSGPVVTGVATMFSVGPYRVPNVDLTGWCVYTNKAPAGAFRGYGNPQAAFAHESQMDILAEKTGLDPIEIRLKNAVREGDVFTLGVPYRGEGPAPTLKAAAEAALWGKRRPKAHRGMGVACIQHVTGGLPSSVILKVNMDGGVSMMLGVPEIGTAVSTTASRIVSEELSLPVELIRIMPVDTDTSPFDHGLGISRCAFNVGHAARLAALDLKRQVLENAEKLLGAPLSQLRMEKGRIVGCTSGEDAPAVEWKDLVVRSFYGSGGPLIGRGSYLHSPEPNDAGTVRGMPIAGFPQFTFATHIAEVEVDPETGRLRLLKIVAAHDVGRPLNPQAVEGQIFGGVVQGIGYAMSEEMHFRKGALLNPNLLDYKPPLATDIPRIVPVIMENPDPAGPYGAKGVGEPPIVPVAPAVANALAAAGAGRIRSLPLTSEKIYRQRFKKTSP